LIIGVNEPRDVVLAKIADLNLNQLERNLPGIARAAT
jgi:hypothetical protein